MKTMTVTFHNIPDDWTEHDVLIAIAIGSFIKTMEKHPELLKKLLYEKGNPE